MKTLTVELENPEKDKHKSFTNVTTLKLTEDRIVLENDRVRRKYSRDIVQISSIEISQK